MIDEKLNLYYNPTKENHRQIHHYFYLTILTSLIADIVLIWIVIVTLHASIIKRELR
jgi:hypothetical protein